MTIEDIVIKLSQYQTKYITVTGGEPLAQENSVGLLNRLIIDGYQVSLETSGAIDTSSVNPEVTKIMDLKTPDSGEEDKNLYTNIEYLNPSDEVKFVICSDNDYSWSKKIIDQYTLLKRCKVLFSPSTDQYPQTRLAEHILEDQLPVRFQIQLHKILWNDAAGK